MRTRRLLAALALLAPLGARAAIAVSSTNWNASAGSATSVNVPSTATISVPAGSVVLALVARYDSTGGQTLSVSTATATGGTLTWTQVDSTVTSTPGTEEIAIFKGTPSAALTNVQVTATSGASVESLAMGVVVITGASSTLGDRSTNANTAGTINVTVNAGTATALVFAVAADFNSTSYTGGTGDTVLNVSNTAGASVLWMRANGTVTGNTNVATSQNGTTNHWVAMGVEIVEAATGSTYNDSLTETPSAADSLATAVTWTNSVAENGAPASDALSTSGTWFNAASESSAASAAVATTATWLNAASEALGASDGLATTHVQPNALAEAASAADALSDSPSGAGSVYNDSVTESAAAGASHAAGSVVVTAIGETVATSAGLTLALVLLGAVSETGSPTEALAAAASFASAVLEDGAGAAIVSAITSGDFLRAPTIVLTTVRAAVAVATLRPAITFSTLRPDLEVATLRPKLDIPTLRPSIVVKR